MSEDVNILRAQDAAQKMAANLHEKLRAIGPKGISALRVVLHDEWHRLHPKEGYPTEPKAQMDAIISELATFGFMCALASFPGVNKGDS